MENKKMKDKKQAIASLVENYGVKNGTEILAKVTHVSKSGMSRRVQLFVISGGKIFDITFLAAQALGWGYKEGYNKGINVTGCGMDMLFHTVDALSYAMGYKALNQGGASTGLKYRTL